MPRRVQQRGLLPEFQVVTTRQNSGSNYPKSTEDLIYPLMCKRTPNRGAERTRFRKPLPLTHDPPALTPNRPTLNP